MKGRALTFTCAIAAGLATTMQFAAAQPPAAPEAITFLGEPVSADRIAQGQEIYANTCSSCHGANLEGQPNWKRRLPDGRMPAPPHDQTGHSWQHPDRQLFDFTKLGIGGVVAGYESDMPAFGDVLTDAEITAVLAYIKSTWPDLQRDMQAKLTAKDEEGS